MRKSAKMTTRLSVMKSRNFMPRLYPGLAAKVPSRRLESQEIAIEALELVGFA
jgi:hypothetical protein